MIKNLEQAIKEAAYYNWQNAGCPQGQDEYFWAMAVEQVSNCKCNKNSCSKTSATKTSSAAKKSTSSKSSASKASTSTKKSK